jgi:hypothetical protein
MNFKIFCKITLCGICIGFVIFVATILLALVFGVPIFTALLFMSKVVGSVCVISTAAITILLIIDFFRDL